MIMRIDTLRSAGALVLALLLLGGCGPERPPAGESGRNFRADMRDLVYRIGACARKKRSGFLVVPQNGLQLLTVNGDPRGGVASRYVEGLDGVTQESLFFGDGGMDQPTPDPVRRRLMGFADLARRSGLPVLVTNYCQSRDRVDRSYALSRRRGYVSFAADSRNLDRIPAWPDRPFRGHCRKLSSLAEAENYLYLLDMSAYPSKNAFVDAVRGTLYDVVITDPYFLGDVPFTWREVQALKRKPCGGNRFVLAYLSIGEAEDYRPYWNPAWKRIPPPWLEKENENWPGNYKVRYWMEDWQKILLGGEGSCLDRIIDAGFDGVVLDIIDAFYYFEEKVRAD
jgi:cysteinyl-tRNA synthetase, unknown class